MTALWIAWRVILEIARDRRTLAFFFLVPLVVMTLIYYAVAEDEEVRVAVLARGAARLFVYDLEMTLRDEEDVQVVTLDIADTESDPDVLERRIRQALAAGRADGVLYFSQQLLVDRFDGRPGTLHLYLEGSRPTRTATVLSAIKTATDELAEALPVVIDPQCSAACANSVNVQPMEVAEHYRYGSEDFRLIDYFLPDLAPFFVFFFTFVIATITFQRERARGTLERLLIAPVSFGQVVLGYVGGFAVYATAQAAIVLAFILALLSFPVTAAQVGALVILTLVLMLIALMLGLLVSFQAASEFQALQFIPLIILPQIFLSDLIWSIQSFPALFRWISYVLPLTHANIAVRDVVIKGRPLWQTWPQLLVLAAFVLVVLAALMAVGRRSGHNRV